MIVCVYPFVSAHLCVCTPLIFEAYEFTLLPVCLRIPLLFRLLCGLCGAKEKWVIISSQNFL